MSGKLYQVQNGQKVDITPKVATLSTGTRRNVGETVFSLVPLDDAGLHLVDGSLLSTTGVYAEGVAAIIALRSNHPNLFTSETMWQQSVNQYGVCGKFVYDAGAGTLRLPKVTGFIEGTLNATALGDLVEAGLPNITGQIIAHFRGRNSSASGAITFGSYTPLYDATLGNADGWTNLTFDASLSNPIYGNSTTVQPQAIKGFLYIVLANTIKTPIQVDIDNIAADLALKADISLGNVNSTGKLAMAHAAMPSDKYIFLSVPATGGTVTAPADGYMVFSADVAASAQSSNYIKLVTTATAGGSITHALVANEQGAMPGTIETFLPVLAGTVVRVNYLNVTPKNIWLVYAVGSAPQP